MPTLSRLPRILLVAAIIASMSYPAAPVLAQDPAKLSGQASGVIMFLPVVKNELGPSAAVRDAYNTLVEFAALKQMYMISVVRAFTLHYTTPFLEAKPTWWQVNEMFGRQSDLWSRQAEVQNALATIEASQTQGTMSSGLSSQGIGSAMKGFWDYLSGSAKRSRDRVLTVASNYTDAQRQQLYDSLRIGHREMAPDSATFWQRFQAGDFDNQAAQIFNDLYHDPDLDFGLDAQDRDLTIQNIVQREGAEGVSKGAELMVEVVKTATPLGEGMDLVEEAAEYAENIDQALTDPKEFIKDEIEDAIAGKLAGFVDVDGLVDAGTLSETAAEAIKVLTDVCLGSDDPNDWFRDAIDWGIGKVLDANETGEKTDIAVAEATDVPGLVQVMISVIQSVNLAGDPEITIGLPEGGWQVNVVNPKGQTDSVEVKITENVSTLIVTNTDPEAGHVGEQLSLSVWISPSNPGVYVDVTVYAKVAPATAGVALDFSVVGTDGYANSYAEFTNAEGIATFYVPGAEQQGSGGHHHRDHPQQWPYPTFHLQLRLAGGGPRART